MHHLHRGFQFSPLEWRDSLEALFLVREGHLTGEGQNRCGKHVKHVGGTLDSVIIIRNIPAVHQAREQLWMQMFQTLERNRYLGTSSRPGLSNHKKLFPAALGKVGYTYRLAKWHHSREQRLEAQWCLKWNTWPLASIAGIKPSPHVSSLTFLPFRSAQGTLTPASIHD